MYIDKRCYRGVCRYFYFIGKKCTKTIDFLKLMVYTFFQKGYKKCTTFKLMYKLNGTFFDN